jgi:uncharacterized protein YndB with AHSA1/START domain
MTDDPRELILVRTIAAPPRAVFRCWTEPALIVRWFTPAPWNTASAEIDLRPGGGNLIVMHGPNGEIVPNRGSYLEIDPPRRLVFTDAFVGDWTPSEEPFFTGVLTFEEFGEGSTLYTARARHWTIDAAKRHADMGFLEGWGRATDQLEALAKTLA